MLVGLRTKLRTRFEKIANAEYLSLLLDIVVTTGLGAVMSAVNYLYNIVLKRYVSDETISIFTVFIAIYMFFQIVSTTVQTSITKLVAAHLEKDINAFFSKYLKLSLWIGLVLTLVFSAFVPLLSKFTEIDQKYLFILAPGLFFTILSTVIKGTLLGLQRFKFVNLIALIESIVRIGGMLLIFHYTRDAFGPLLAYIIPTIISTLVLLVYMKFPRREVSLDIDLDTRYMLIMLATFSFFTTVYTLDGVYVAHEYRALYSALADIGKIVYFGSILVVSVMFSRVSKEKDPVKQRSLFLISLAMNLSISLTVSLIYAIFGEEIVKFIYNGRFLEIAPYMTGYGLVMALYAASYLAILFMITKDEHRQNIVLGAAALLQFILFRINNSSLRDAFFNQTFVILFLSIGIGFIFVMDFIKSKRRVEELP